MRRAVIAVVLSAVLAGDVEAQTLHTGDRLVYETVAAFGFEALPQAVPDPCTIETRLTIEVAKVDRTGMDVDVDISIGVRAVRYRGPSFCWAIEPATPDGFIGAPLSALEAQDLEHAVLPSSLPPLAQEVVRKELSLVATVASLHGRRAAARVACGPEPFARVDHLDVPAFGREQRLLGERYLRTALLLLFPPVPLDLPRNAEAFEAGGAAFEVVGYRNAVWPIRGREHRVRALRSSSAARAAFAFEAMHDTGLEAASEKGPRVREWADVHAALGIAARRHVRVTSQLARREGSEPIAATATWYTDLVRATARAKARTDP